MTATAPGAAPAEDAAPAQDALPDEGVAAPGGAEPPRAAGVGRSPGRPRSTRVDEVIIDSVLDLLAEGQSPESLSIEAIATRAGVGKATIYRRWSGKETLLHDVVASLKEPPRMPETGSVRGDLIALVSLIGHSRDPRAAKIMPCLLPEMMRNPGQFQLYQEVAEPRREVMRQVLRRGIARGEVRADTDIEVVLAMVAGPILIQKLLRWNPDLKDDQLPDRIVDLILAAITPTPAPPI